MLRDRELIDEKYSIMLPCEPANFGKFISGLLGKPQTIEKRFRGLFCIDKDEVVNVYHLVDQRISQQNAASLVQFTVKIFYSDDSSVLLNSLEDFEHYNEVRPLKSVAITLSWTYIIRFQQKEIPEKQQIDLSFRTGNSDDDIIEDGIIISSITYHSEYSGIFMRINHTERTWGLDIEALLSGYVKNIIVDPNSAKDFVSRHNGKIGFMIGALFFLGAIIGAFVATNRFIQSYMQAVTVMAEESKSASELLAVKIDFLLNVIATGAWPRFTLSVVGFVVVALIVAVFFGTLVSSRADNNPKSFVLLTKGSRDDRNSFIAKRRRDWIMFIISVLVSIATGVIANIVFAVYFGKF